MGRVPMAVATALVRVDSTARVAMWAVLMVVRKAEANLAWARVEVAS